LANQTLGLAKRFDEQLPQQAIGPPFNDDKRRHREPAAGFTGSARKLWNRNRHKSGLRSTIIGSE
jgi:hypothetical protein